VSNDLPDILLVTGRISSADLRSLVEQFFHDMVKFVVDINRGIVAVGGELHADAKAFFLDAGCRQQDLWGANYYPERGPDDCIEYTALINIRPAQGNRSMEVEDADVRDRIRDLTFRLTVFCSSRDLSPRSKSRCSSAERDGLTSRQLSDAGDPRDSVGCRVTGYGDPAGTPARNEPKKRSDQKSHRLSPRSSRVSASASNTMCSS
jgi:hypothetical protein